MFPVIALYNLIGKKSVLLTGWRTLFFAGMFKLINHKLNKLCLSLSVKMNGWLWSKVLHDLEYDKGLLTLIIRA